MAIGDHLRVQFGTYFHHGICLGDQRVVHYGNGIHQKANAKIEIVPIDVFANGRNIETVHSPTRFAASEIAERARRRVGEHCYDLFENNCEHFAHWCRSDNQRSPQIERADIVARRSIALGSKLAFLSGIKKGMVGQTTGRIFFGRLMPGQLIADSIQAGTELLARRTDRTRNHAERIGNTAGAVAATSFGLIWRGPVGALACGSIWLAGQIASDETIRAMKSLCRRPQR